MAATVLNSPRAVEMSVFVVRAFVRMRTVLGGNQDLARKLEELESMLKSRLDVHEAAIVDVLQQMLKLLNPPPPPPDPPRRKIGFIAREGGSRYRRSGDAGPGADMAKGKKVENSGKQQRGQR